MSSNLELQMVLKATDQGLSGTVRSVKQDVDALDTALNETAKSAGKSDTENRKLGEGFKDTGRQAGKADKEISDLNKKVDKNATKTKKAEKENKGFIGTIKDGAAKVGIWGVALAGATAVVAGLAGAIRTDAIREMDAMADAVGVSTQAMSEWQYAAESLYMPADKMGDVFKDLEDKVADFATTGGGEAADLFENLNLKLSDLTELPADQKLLAIGGALDELDNRGQQIFFLESLADDASRLLPLLENGGEGLKKMQLQAQVLGISISDIDAAKVSQAGAAMGQVGGIFKGMANDLTIELAPVLGGISDSLVESAVEAGGFRNAMRTAIDWTVAGVGFALDIFQQFRVISGHVEVGLLTIGQAGTAAMAAVADSTASVINDALKPMQTALAWVIDKYAQWVEFVSRIGGPIADQLKGASEWLKGFSNDVADFSVGANDIIKLNESMAAALSNAATELDSLINADAPSEQLKVWVQNLRTESESAARAQQNLGKQTEKTSKVITSQTDANADLVKGLEDELELIGLSNRDREIEIGLRKLSADATDEQKDKVRELTGELYDYGQAQKQAEQDAQAWATITENALTSVDDSFRDLFRSGLDGWDDFWDSMQSTAKNMLAELAYTLVKQKLWVNVGLNVTGQQSGVAGQIGSAGSGGFSLSNLTGLGSNITSLFTSNSIGQTIAGVGADLFGTASNTALVSNAAAVSNGAVSVSNPLAGAAGLSNLAMVGGGLGGSLLSGALGLSGEYSPITSAVGTVAGAALLTPILGPLAPFVGSFLGDALGGLFGGEPSDRTQWAGYSADTGQVFSGGENGDKAWTEGRQQAEQMAATLAAFDAALGFYDGSQSGLSYQLTMGQRDGYHLRATGDADLSYTPNGSPTLGDGEAVYAGKDTAAMLDAALEHMAAAAEISLDLYRALQADGEVLAQTYERVNAQFVSVTQAAELLNLQFDALDDAGFRAADALVEAAGGLESFQAKTAFYHAQFFTEEERKAQVTNAALDQVKAWNDELGRSGAAFIDSREEFRAYIETLDLTTAAGQQAWASAMQLAGAIVTLDDAMNGSQLGTLQADQQGWFTDQAQLIADNYQRELAQLNDLHRTRVATLNAELNVARQLQTAVTNLKLSDVSPLTADQRVDVARTELARLQVLVESGNIDAASQVGSAAQAYLRELSAQRGADGIYVNEFNEVTQYLEDLGLSLGSDLDPLAAIQQLEQQLLSEQRALNANSRAELTLLADQYAELTGIDSGIGALNDLLAGLPDALRESLAGLLNSATGNSAADNNVTLSDGNFINQLYNTGLNRGADSAGTAYWQAQLDSGMSRETLKETFFKAAHENDESNITYFAGGGVVSRAENFSFGRDISSQLGQRGEAGAEAIIPVGSGYIPAKFDNSLINEVRELRKQNAEQAQQISQLNDTLNKLVQVTDSHGQTAKTQRDRQSRELRRSNRQPVRMPA